jgi:hypothetical protein
VGALAVPPAVAGGTSGGGFELTAVVVPANQDGVSDGGGFELRGGIRQAPLRIYGGEYSLGVSAGFDTKVLTSCECLCWGLVTIFADGFESGDTGEWSTAVP